jgi:dihydropyrimidinase
VIWDPKAEKTISKKTHHQAVDFNIFEGLRVKGLAQTTISGGRVVYNEGVVTSQPGSGRYIGRGTYGFAYERIAPRDVQRKIKETPVDRSGKVTEATLSEKVKQLKTELEIANDQVKQL